MKAKISEVHVSTSQVDISLFYCDVVHMLYFPKTIFYMSKLEVPPRWPSEEININSYHKKSRFCFPKS